MGVMGACQLNRVLAVNEFAARRGQALTFNANCERCALPWSSSLCSRVDVVVVDVVVVDDVRDLLVLEGALRCAVGDLLLVKVLLENGLDLLLEVLQVNTVFLLLLLLLRSERLRRREVLHHQHVFLACKRRRSVLILQ